MQYENVITSRMPTPKTALIFAGMHFRIFFTCEVGVKQCENLSSFLFSLCLNDLENILNDNYVQSEQ
jgi:hypothetical protein